MLKNADVGNRINFKQKSLKTQLKSQYLTWKTVDINEIWRKSLQSAFFFLFSLKNIFSDKITYHFYWD